ncbi:MAG: hypothetical protein M5U28_46950 [Sandaracinaceae bacterium]|nr:hypothetical protein [Sandaracinaceae bacterium]
MLAGRAAREVGGACIDVDGLALDAARAALRQRVPRLDVDRHVRMSTRIRPGSRELVGAFMRQAETGVWLANDTSIGVGHAPLSALERTVLALERRLSGDEAVREHPARGVDVKVMAVRRGEATEVTIACALIGGGARGPARLRAGTPGAAARRRADGRGRAGIDQRGRRPGAG